MLRLALRNLVRRPIRNGLAVAGLALAVAVLASLSSFGRGYRRALAAEIDGMGLQMMLVPLGCPYDAAARVLKGKTLDNSLPESALEAARKDPAVAIAAPLLTATLPRSQGRTDLWVGLDQTAVALKPWWRAKSGQSWFASSDSVILGAEASEVEMRAPGDLFYSPESQRRFEVAGVLERSGTSDDNMFFVPLATAQEMFHQPGRLTAIAIRLRDPSLMRETSQRLQQIPGAQVVTLTEMMGTFLNLLGAVRTLLIAIGVVAMMVSILGVFNTLLATVLERTHELSVMRAIGASRGQVVSLIATEAIMLTTVGSLAGIVLTIVGGHGMESLAKQWVPLAPIETILRPDLSIVFQSLALGVAAGVAGGLYPAWRAARLHPAESLRAE